MAATNFTPLQLYYSSTATNTPTAGNLLNGELAINITDGKLFYKDNAGVVQTLATKSSAAGSFTTLSASSTVSGTGFSNYLASPPAIGGTVAAAGTFTTLSATSLSLSALNNTPIGSTTPSTGAFTTLSASSAVSGTGFSTYLDHR